MTSKKIKSISFLLCLFLMVPFAFISPYIRSVSAEDSEQTVILSSNLVRNFEFDSFAGIDLNGSNSAFGGKLKFEMLPTWQISKDDVSLVHNYIIGDKLYLYYQVGITNSINIYTNLNLAQVAPNGLSPQAITLAATDVYWVPWWAITKIGFLTDGETLTYNCYDFGDVLNYNALQNTFSGDLTMTFDIDTTPVPSALTDSLGNTHEEEFAYIGLSSAAVTNTTWGLMSNDMPVVQGIAPSESTTSSVSDYSTTLSPDDRAYYVRPELTVDSSPSTVFGQTMQAQTANSSLNPKAADGSPLWSPDNETSMTDGQITFNIGSISPKIYKWESELDYTYWEFIHKEMYWWQGWQTSTSMAERSVRGDAALHLINRYIQAQIKLVFDVYACFDLDLAQNTLNNYILGFPQEWYDEIVWTSTIEGTTAGVEANPPSGGFWNFLTGIGGIFTLIITAIIVIVVLYIVIKYGLSALRRRSGSGGGNTVYINTK